MKTTDFLNEAESLTGQAISSCYQCYKCTNGCPVAIQMDLYPHQVIGGIIQGRRQEILASNASWVCLQCMTCSTRCPNGIDIARVLDRLRSLAVREGAARENPQWIFDNHFLKSVRRNGRLYELGAILGYKAASKSFFEDAEVGLAMFRRGRLGLVPHRIRDRRGFHKMLKRLDELRSGGVFSGGASASEDAGE